MSKRNTGKDFEDLVHRVYSTALRQNPLARVSRNERLDSADGKREVDILIEHAMAGSVYRTVIECKDYRRPVAIDLAEQFAKKLQNLHAAMGIMVSRSGFTDGARSVARRENIELKVAERVSQASTGIFQRLPLHLRRLQITRLLPFFKLGMFVPKTADLPLTFNQVPVEAIVLEGAKRGLIRSDLDTLGIPDLAGLDGYIALSEFFNSDAIWINKGMQRAFVHEARIGLEFSATEYFGYVDAFATAVQLVDATRMEATIALDLAEIPHVVRQLTPIQSVEDIPAAARDYGLSILAVDVAPPVREAPTEIRVWRPGAE